MRRPTVLSLPVQLVFPVFFVNQESLSRETSANQILFIHEMMPSVKWRFWPTVGTAAAVVAICIKQIKLHINRVKITTKTRWGFINIRD
jgi:hypothetical protein